MINYSCKKFTAHCLMILSAVVLLLSSCTEVNDLLGADYVPDDQGMKVGITSTTEGVMTSTFYTSVESTGMGSLPLGRAYSSTYGETTLGFLTQYLPYFSTNEDDDEDGYTPFGLTPVVDSLILNVWINSVFEGDSTVVQTANIYVLSDDIELDVDSTYYSSYDYKDFISEDYIAQFDFAGTYISEALTVALDKDFAETLFYAEGGAYKHDTLFLEKFRGLGFFLDESSADGGSLYSLSAGAMTMNLYYRNFDKTGAVYDTCYYIYSFNDSYTTYATSVGIVDHDYTNSQVTVQSETAQEVTYVQGYAGVTTLLTFQDEFIEELRSLAGEGTEYSDIAINKAELIVYTVDSGEDAHEYSPSRLGMYFDYATMTNITDYNFEYEDGYSVSIPYDGYLEGTLSQYTMDITSYFSDLVAGDDDVVSSVVLGMTYSSQTSFAHVALNGSASDNPPLLKVTYTLIK